MTVALTDRRSPRAPSAATIRAAAPRPRIAAADPRSPGGWPASPAGLATGALSGARSVGSRTTAPAPVSSRAGGQPWPLLDAVASAGRRACPRRSPRASRARRAVGPTPPSRARLGPRRAPRAAPRASGSRSSPSSGRTAEDPIEIAQSRPARGRHRRSTAIRRSIRRLSSRTRSKTTASAAEMLRSSSSAAPNASRAVVEDSGSSRRRGRLLR